MRKSITIPWIKYPESKKVKPLHKKHADRLAKDIKNHFKKDGWPLRYNFYVQELANSILGYQVETILLNRIRSKKLKLQINNNGELMIMVNK